MENTTVALTLSLIAGLSTIIGSIFIFFKKDKSILLNSFAFAAGVMITVSLIDLIPESFSYLSTYYYPFPALLFVLICFVIGVLISSFIDYYIPENNPIYKIGIISLIAIIMHNIPEGMATFIASNTDIKLGITLTIAIALHNIPEGITIALPIFYSTKSRKRALLYTTIAGLSEFFGALITCIFLKDYITYKFMGYLLAIIAGIMIQISFYELLPEVWKARQKRGILYFLLGSIIMFLSIKII
jgi:zinc/iron permease